MRLTMTGVVGSLSGPDHVHALNLSLAFDV
jgi:hypothetical protein